MLGYCRIYSLITLVALAVVGATSDELMDFIEKERLKVNPRFRPHYHVAAPVGWINDPNGFSFYDGYYHLFYQYHPFSSFPGLIHWGHVRSADLATWEELPVALRPDQPFDINGCFSGSAVDAGGIMVIFYTGYIIDETEPPGFKQVQNIAYSKDGVVFKKDASNPILAQPPDGNFHFRDPKVWRHMNDWYMVLGNPNAEGHGRVIFYSSKDLFNWEYLGVLAESDGSVGYMWECPDFFELNGKFVLLMSPQGMEPVGDRYHNLYQAGYIIGDFDYETKQFVPDAEGFIEMDYGFEFYAAQTMQANDGRRLVVAWLSMWEENFEEAEDGWSGMLTIPRELNLDENNRLIMSPARELLKLREKNAVKVKLLAGERLQLGVSSEIKLSARRPADGGDVSAVFELGEGREMKLVWRPSNNTLELQRNGDLRRAPFSSRKNLKCRLFLDASSLEVFCDEAVFSSRIYPRDTIQLLALDAAFSLEVFTLRRGVAQ